MIACARDAENRKIVGFRTAAGEHHFGRPAPQQRSNRVARTLHRRPRLLPVVVDGRGIAKVVAEVRAHGLENLR